MYRVLATPSSRRRVDGVKADAAIQDERAVYLISTQVPLRRPREVFARERRRVFTTKSVRSRRGVRGAAADGLQPRARHVDAL